MQSTLPFPPVAGLPGQKTTEGTRGGTKGKLESSEQNLTGAESGILASFLTIWNQALEQLEDGKAQTDDFLDLTLSAEQGETSEERTASLPLDCIADTVSFSKSILDFMASVKAGLEEKGIDVNALSAQVEEVLDESLPNANVNLDRLKAMLSKLQNRYATLLQNDGPRRLDLEVAVADELKIGLGAYLKPHYNVGVFSAPIIEAEDAEEVADETGEPLPSLPNAPATTSQVPVFSEGDHAEKTEDLPEEPLDPLIVSRLYSYLKADVSRALSAAKSEAAKEPSEEKKTSSVGSRGAEPTVRVNMPLSSGQDAPKEDALAMNPEEKDLLRNEAEGEHDKKNTRENVASNAEKKEDEGQLRPGVTERKTTNFEQFFDGIMARRNQPDTRVDAMELTKESVPSRSEVFREGVENVVRFIRANGEQKASLIVDPPALGRLTVELTSSTAGLEASIKVSSEQIRQLVQDQIVQLRMSLAQQGVQLTHFSVDVQQDNSRHHQGSEQKSRKATRGISGEEDPDDAQDEQTSFRVDLNQGLLYWVA